MAVETWPELSRTMSEFMQRCKYFFKTEAVEKNGGYKSSSRDLSGMVGSFRVRAICKGDDVYFSVENSQGRDSCM